MHRRLRAAALAACLAAVLGGCEDAARVEAAQHALARGLALVGTGEEARAADALREAAALDPSLAAPHLALARLFARRGESGLAVASLKRAVRADGTSAEAHAALSRALLEHGRGGDALGHALMAHRLAPEDAGVLALTSAAALAGDVPDLAVAMAGRAVSLDPVAPGAQAAMVEAVRRRDGPTAAVETLAALPVGADPRLLALHLSFHDRLGRPDLALAHLAAVARGPLTRDARLARAERLVAAGRVQEALAALEALADVAPGDVEVLAALHRLMTALIGPDAARRDLARRTAAGAFRQGELAHCLLAAGIEASAGDLPAAAAALARLAPHYRDRRESAVAITSIAGLWLDAGDPARALAAIDAALPDAVAPPSVLALRGEIALALGRPADAVPDLRRAAEAVPGRAEGWIRLAEALARAGAAGEAEALLASLPPAVARDPRAVAARAWLLSAAGRGTEALRLLEGAHAARPADAAGARALAEARLAAGDWTGAAGIVGRSFLHGPDGPGEALLAGILATAEGASEGRRALRVLDRLATRAADDAALRRQATAVLAASAAPMVAERRWRDLAAHAPADPAAWIGLATHLERTGRPEGALAELGRGIGHVVWTAPLRLHRAGLLERLGRRGEAIAEYEVLHAMDPRSFVIANNLASLLLEGEPDAAALARARVLAARLEHAARPEFRDTYGWMLHLGGDHAGAIAALEPAAAALPEVAVVHYHLGMSYAAAGRYGAARQALGRALSLDLAPEFGYEARVRQVLARLDIADIRE